MNQKTIPTFFFLLFLFTNLAPPVFTQNIDTQTFKETLTKLSKDPTWHKLIHYKKTWNNTYKSAITSRSFFLSKQGKNNPKLELIATINAFLAPTSSSPDKHTQCQFPARFIWIKKKLNSDISFPKISCKQYDNWSKSQNYDSLSVLFPSGFFENPASFFGHVLLKFSHSTQSDLLSKSINYGAIVPRNENIIAYISNGLFGGYKAAFSDKDYYLINHLYSESENRDIWEYKLNISKDKITFLMAHIWELLGQTFPYYFISDNCAYRVSELLSLVIHTPLSHNNTPWHIPVNMFHNLAQSSHSKEKVQEIKFVPARKTYLTDQFLNIDTKQQQLITSIIKQNKQPYLLDKTYQQSTETQKQTVSAFLISYYTYLIETKKHSKKNLDLLESKKNHWLYQRMLLPSRKQKPIQAKSLAPHQNQKPSMLQGSVIHNKNNNINTLQIRLQGAYYDLLSPGFSNISRFKLGDLSIQYQSKKVFLKQLNIIDILSLNPAKSTLPIDQKLAWSIKAGLDNTFAENSSQQVVFVQAGLGKSWYLSKNVVLFSLAEASISTKSTRSTLTLIPNAGMLWALSNHSKLLFSINQYISLNKAQKCLQSYKVAWGYSFSSSYDLRLTWEKLNESQMSLAIGYYW